MLENLLVFYARRFPIRRAKLRLVNLLWRAAIANSRSTQRVATLKYGDFKMACDLREMLQRQFYFFGTYFLEEHILTCWCTAAKEAKVIFDVGANAGIYSLAALAVRPDASVHAFEPTREIASRLRATTMLNGLNHLYVHEIAVLNEDGQAVLKRFRGAFGDNEGMNVVSKEEGDVCDELVPTVSLDNFCDDRSIENIDLLKIDVQGQEHSVLRGAKNLIEAGRVGTVFMELNWGTSTGLCPATESINLLTEADYVFSEPGEQMKWKGPGNWLRHLSDVVARRVRC